MTTPPTELAAKLESLAKRLKSARHAVRLADEAKALALRSLSTAEANLREARQLHDLLEDEVIRAVGGTPTPREKPLAFSRAWDEVWCPKCHVTFRPSIPGPTPRV